MKLKGALLGSLGLMFVLATLAPAQQSLGEIARRLRKEQAAEGTKAVKVYTNDNLPAGPPTEGAAAPTSVSGTPSSTTAMTSASTEKAPVQTKQSNEQQVENKQKTKDYWQAKFKAARAQLARAKEEQQLVEDELQLLGIQQVRELSPEVQQDVAQKIAARNAELQAKQAATAEAQQKLDDLENQFKESGAPEDWSKTE